MRLALSLIPLVLLGPVAAGAAGARETNWADVPDARAPAYAPSRAICRKLGAATLPAGDLPTPAEAAGLADCSSQALYYGIGRPADPKAARLCAVVENRSADPQVTDFGFTGDRMLMTVYANGRGAARDLDLATALACRAGGAPAEIDGRVLHLAKLKAEGWTGTDFSLCDDATSGLLQGVCADHDQLIARDGRARAFAALSVRWTAAERAAVVPLQKAAAAFVDARGQNEVDQSGTGRGAFVVAAEEKAEGAFARLLADAEAGRIAPASADDAKAADAALNAGYRALLAKAPALARDTTLTAAGLAATERAWLRYRDAWLAFARLRYPALPPDALLARLTRDRTAQLADIPAATD
ncbi:lysozyme inhibitor LprI family protein [Lichenibacterium ramalinae]|uniref:DUF1311 domain-containing protein n=1 Tax=Lichenibacterium ramalinae TaxID=2316527 RepID=A0A4Q2RF91_9HYPH|nr:lysozyme inhibitor LprI family protein [Lichenibacterium ramalinae]RYB05919.1 DUF1311 domain-containing protein [Lichenibacterium ramalinae]